MIWLVPIYEKKTNKTGSKNINQHSSNIEVAGNLSINAEENLKIEGSNVNISGDGNINANKVDITSVAENSSSYTKDKSIEIGELDVGFRDNSFKAGVKGTGKENKYQEETTTQKASNINIGNNLLINSSDDIDVVASNVAVSNNADVKTGGSFNLSDAKNTQTTNTENSNLEVEVGVKVGNAYVDAGVAVKALADATKNLKKANQKLNRMKSLKSQGRASQKAVDLAIAQVALATAGVATATANVAMSAQNAAAAASTSFGTGMYAAGYMDTSYDTDFLKTKNEQSVGSAFVVGNNIDINAGEDYNQTGSLLASKQGNVNITAKEANIKSGESTFQSDYGSKQITSSVSLGNNGVGLSAGYNQSDNFTLSNTHTNSEILAENGTFNLNTTKNANIKGGNITANEVALNVGGDLNIETVQDTYEQQGSSFGLGIGAGVNQSASLNNASISLGATEIFTKTTSKRSGIIELASNDNNLNEEQNLNNLLNSNSVNVLGNIDNQTVKKDIDFTNADFEGTLSVPVELLTESGRARMKDAFANFDKNIMTATAGAVGTAYHAGKAISDTATGKTSISETTTGFLQDRKAMTTSIRRGGNELVRDGLNDSSNQSPEELAALLAHGVEVEERNILYANEGEVNKDGELVLGFNDSNSQGYINLANTASNTYNLIGTDAEERAHLVTSNENIAESANNSAQLGWKISNLIHGDSVNTNGLSQKSWNNNHANHPVLQHNANVAASVPEQNRDYNTVLVGGAGYENETKIYMKKWEEKFEKAGVVDPEYVPISQGGKAGNILTTVLNVDGNVPYVLSDNIMRSGTQ